MAEKDSLEQFFAGIRASCNEHAKRKGYTKESADDGNVLGPAMKLFDIEAPHAIGEILAKLVEFQRTPKRHIAEKVAGWSWRLWLSCKE